MADAPTVEFDILFVEDNPGDRDLIIEHLEQSGRSFHVETAGSLAEALRKRNKRNFDIVLLDLGLPDAMGLETLTRFRAHAPEIPIIVLTGWDDDEAGIEAIRNGAQDYLVKGQVNTYLLVRSLRHAIERHILKGKVDHYNRVLRAIRSINQLIVREKDPAQLIRQACKVLIETRGYKGVWAALGNCSTAPSVIEQAGFDAVFGSMAEDLAWGIWPPCVDKVLKSDERIVIVNPSETCDCPLSAKYHQNSIGISLLKNGDRIYGVLAASSANTFEIGKEEKSLLHEISNDISFALHALETKKQHRDAEEHIRQQHLFLQLLMDAIPMSVFYKDTRGIYVGCNETFADSLGRPKSDIIGKKVHDLFPEELARQHQKMDTDLLKMPGLRQYESWIQQTDGKRSDILINKASYLDFEGNVAGIIGATLDITDRKAMEKRLLQSQKMESIGTLAGGIAHDFNNILAAIIGFTELSIQTVEKGSGIESDLQEIYTAANRAKDLVKQILTFARLSDEEIRPIQPTVIVKEVLKFIRSSIPSTIDIEQDLRSDSFIMGNATQIHQVMMNLCTNAAQSMEEKGGRLRVVLEDIRLTPDKPKHLLDLKPGDYITIMVSDTGTGIPPEIIGSIFEPYFTTKGPGEGTGMGLAMVHGIVQTYGGRIFVDSTPEMGTTFTLYLPINKKGRGKATYKPEGLPGGKERILVLDDEAPVAKLNGMILESLGYSVTTVTASIEALALFRSKPNDFDLVLSDMTMPKMTGDLLALELMKIRPEIPIILCTGYSKKISGESAKDMGVKAFLYKPVVKADLAKTVRKVLDRDKADY